MVLIVVLGSTVAVAGGGASPQSDATTEEAESVKSNLEAAETGDDWSLPVPIDAAVTTEPTYVDGRLVVGSERGLYVFEDESLEQFVPTGPVRSIGAVADGMVVALVDDQESPNVMGVDLSNGEVVWSTARQRSVYSPDVGYEDRQVPAFDSEPIGDVDDDGTGDVAVSMGAGVVAVSGATGEHIWSYEHERNVWQLSMADGTLFAGSQSGHLLALGPRDGALKYAERIAEPFESDGGSLDAVPRSVWSVEPVTVGGGERVAVTTEAGDVAVVEPSDGTVEWRTSITEFDGDLLERYYRSGDRTGTPTAPGDAHYFNLDLTVVEDGGDAKLAVDATVEEQPDERGYESATSELHLLDAKSGDREWSTDRIDLASVGSIVSEPGIEDGNLLLATPPEQGTQEISVVSLADGSAAGTIAIDVVPGTERRGPQTGVGYIGTNGEDLAVAAAAGDLSVVDASGAVQWSYPVLTEVRVAAVADFTGDGTDDYLLTAPTGLERETQSRSMQVRSGVDGSIVWSASLDADAVLGAGGYAITRPIDGDGGADILSVRQHPNRDKPGGVIAVLSGDDGSVTNQFQLAGPDGAMRLASVEPIGDATGNGKQDAIVGGHQGVAVVDLAEGAVVWQRVYDERRTNPGTDDGATAWNPFEEPGEIHYRTVGGDATGTDVVAMHPRTGGIATVRIDTSGDGLSFETLRQTSIDGNIDPGTIESLGDLTDDGVDDLYFEYRSEDESKGAVFSPAAGEIVTTVSQPQDLSLVTTEGDFTGDGTPGMVIYRGADTRTVTAYSGVEEVWSTQVERPRTSATIHPAAPAGDVDGDGSEEIALVEGSERDGSGARVTLYDVATGDRVETMALDAWEDGVGEPQPGQYAERIPDRTGDGQPELGAVAPTRYGSQGSLAFYVADPSEGELLISGDGAPNRFLELDEGVGIVEGGSVQSVDVTSGVTLREPQVGSPVQLEWTFDAGTAYVTTVTVNDRPVAITPAQETAVDLPPGTHEIGVQATGPDGISVHDSTTVTVEGGSSMDLVLYGMTALSVLVLFALGRTGGLVGRVRR